jgi:hypothetical protein
VVLVFLRPADEPGTVAVDPGVAGLNDPAAGAPARRARLLVELLAAGTDMRRRLVVGDDLAGLGVVVGLV